MNVAQELGLSETDPQARADLVKRIEVLPVGDQRYLALRFQHGLRSNEIARLLHEDQSAVEARLRKIIKAIQPELVDALVTRQPPANFTFNGKPLQ